VIRRWHNRQVMESSLGPLLPLFERERARGRSLALGMLVGVAGSTYRKPGALMLIGADGDYAGLLSGGCLEGDLAAHSRSVIGSGTPALVRYDTRGPDDLVWGLGLGCEGMMDILLLRCGPQNDYQPLNYLAAALAAHRRTAIGVVIETGADAPPLGSLALPPDAPQAGATLAPLQSPPVHQALAQGAADLRVRRLTGPHGTLLVVPLVLPPRLLLLGAGPDALPLTEFAARLNWKVTLVDHRPSYAVPARFPAAERVVLARPEAVGEALDLAAFDAAVVMSHHLPSDLHYLRALTDSPIPYVGLLGPPLRRERLMEELGAAAPRLRPRLRSPVGLPLGGRGPESIALAIIAELHTFIHDTAGEARVTEAPAAVGVAG
jgi:xanthine dehydrogenase accessory factor